MHLVCRPWRARVLECANCLIVGIMLSADRGVDPRLEMGGGGRGYPRIFFCHIQTSTHAH